MESLLTYLESFSQNINPTKTLLEPLMQKSDDQEGEAQPITTINFISDYHSIFQKLSYAGISLAEEE